MLTIGGARYLGPAHREVIARALAADPVASCLVASRFEQAGMDPRALGGRFLGVAGGRDGLCFDGGNLIPLHGDVRAMGLIAASAARRPRSCASILGAADLVLALWERLSPAWGTARDVRANQPLLACPAEPAVAPDPLVRQVDPHELGRYLPAAIAMFTEEVGVDPRRTDGGAGYRARIGSLITQGLAFARIENGEVLFKAEVGAVSSRVALIQGVWVHPGWRGRGLAAPATAAVVRHIQQQLRRLPSLYVNNHNVPAQACYARVGFTQVGTFASVLF